MGNYEVSSIILLHVMQTLWKQAVIDRLLFWLLN